MVDIDNFLIYQIFSYLPLIHYNQMKYLNHTYYKYHKDRVKKIFPILKIDACYSGAFLTSNSKIIDTKIEHHIDDIIKTYQKIYYLYRLFFQTVKHNTPSIFGIDPINKNLTLKKKSCFIKKYLYKFDRHFDFRFFGEKKKRLPWHLTIIGNIISKPNISDQVYYFQINEHYYYIRGWTKYLTNSKECVYLKSRQFIEWLLILIREHIGNYIFIEDKANYKLKHNKNSNNFFKEPKYIYCSGKNKYGKQCRNKISFSTFKKNNKFNYYCPFHKYLDKHYLTPSILNLCQPSY